MAVLDKLAKLGLTLPKPTPSVANYVPYKLVLDKTASGVLYISGQIPTQAGELYRTGRLGDDISLEDGIECARICALNGLAWINEALSGDFDRVWDFVMVRGFVACTPEFRQHPQVLNGCSDLLVDLFGERGRHARAAVGAPSLPLGAPVEIDFIVSVQ